MTEIYVNISNFPNYQISNFGNCKIVSTGQVLKPGTNREGYLFIGLTNNGDRSTIKIHRLVANAFIENPESKLIVDHINHDKKNNMISNLRWATKTENNQNKSIMKNNTSGYSGITFVEKSNKWRAIITVNKKPKHLGYFVLKEDAITARANAEILYFQEFRSII